jgi:hypothetical protein
LCQPPTHGTLLQLTYPTGPRRQCPKAWLEVLHRAAQHPCAIQYDPLTKQISFHNTLRDACAAAMQHTYMSWHALPTRTTEQLSHCRDDEVYHKYHNYIDIMKPGWIPHMATNCGL